MKKYALTLLLGWILLLTSGCQNEVDNSYTGFVEDDTNNITVYQSGKIETLLFSEGDFVNAGDLIATLDDEALQIQIRKLKTQIESQEISYALLEDEIDDRDVLAVQRQLEGLDGKIKLANENITQLTTDLERMKTLYNAGATTKDALEKATLALEESKTNLNTLNKERSQVYLSYETLDEGVDLRKLEQINLSIAQLQDDIALLELNIDDCRIYAPIDGNISVLNFDQSDYVIAGSSLGTILAEKPYVIFYIENTSLNQIGIGDMVSVLQDGNSVPFEGTIYYISEEAQFTPKNVTLKEDRQQLVHEVRAYLPVSQGFLPGMMVDVTINN